MSVAEAVERDLDAVREASPDLADSALAATALALAAEIDEPKNSATSKSMCAARLNETMATLRELMPPKREADGIDDIAEQRKKRRAVAAEGGAASADLPCP